MKKKLNCKNGCKKIIFCREVCRACYSKIWYEEYERENRGAKKHIPLPIGSKYINTYGYVIIKTPTGKRQLEHRYVMEQFLGRKLFTYESVHHKKGNKQDNRIEELELWVTKQPKGQRPADLIEYAEWILKTYKNTNGSKTKNNHTRRRN